MEIQRGPEPLVADIGTSAADSTEIKKGFKTTGSIQLPSGSGTTEITVYAQLGSENYDVAENEDGQPIKLTNLTAGRPRELRSSVYAFPRIKLVASKGTETKNVPVSLTS